MSVEILSGEDSLTVLLKGEIDHHSLISARSEIDSRILTSSPKLVILDFGGVSFMDSSGIGLILGRKRVLEGTGGRVAVKNANGYVEKIIRLAGLSSLILRS